MKYSDLVNRRHQLVTLSSTSSMTTVSFRNSHNIPNGAIYRKDCRLECYSLGLMYSPALRTSTDVDLINKRTSSNLLHTVCGLVQLK